MRGRRRHLGFPHSPPTPRVASIPVVLRSVGAAWLDGHLNFSHN